MRSCRVLLLLILGVAAMGGGAGVVSAQDLVSDSLETDRELLERVQQLENQIDQLQRESMAPAVQPTGHSTVLPELPAPPEVDSGRTSGTSPPELQATVVPEESTTTYWPQVVEQVLERTEYPTVKVGGFFHADGAWFNQNQANRRAVGDVQDGFDFRRARLNAHGKAYENVSYMLEMDFGFPGRPTFMDVFLDVHEIPLLGNVRVGHWRQPFGMDALTSVKELPFIERALPFAFLPFRQTGIGFYDHADDEDMTWAGSFFRYPADQFGTAAGDTGGYGFAGRVTGLPVFRRQGKQLVHLGAAYLLADPANNTVIFASAPEVFMYQSAGLAAPTGVAALPPAFVNTGLIPATNVQLFGLEAAAVYDSFYMQSEWMMAHVNQTGNGSVTFNGGYALAAYLLTGEVRPYNRKAGVLGRVKPLQNFKPGEGWGAWEVAARYSYIDLNDNPINGGRLGTITGGVNWYLNPNTKFQFNYVHAMAAHPGVGNGNGRADMVVVRAQVDF